MLEAKCTHRCVWLEAGLPRARLRVSLHRMLCVATDHRQVHRNNPRCKFTRDEESKHPSSEEAKHSSSTQGMLRASCCLRGIVSGVGEPVLTEEDQLLRPLLDLSWNADLPGRQPHMRTNTYQFVVSGTSGY